MDNRSAIERQIAGALRSCIHAHGPITAQTLGSAAKRVYSQVSSWANEKAARDRSETEQLREIVARCRAAGCPYCAESPPAEAAEVPTAPDQA
jgi:hypothetical protein